MFLLRVGWDFVGRALTGTIFRVGNLFAAMILLMCRFVLGVSLGVVDSCLDYSRLL